ncbi:hypothetical protein D9M73_194100 [compost metagenome]
MATDTDLVRHRLDGVGHRQQNIFEVRLQAGAAQIEHRPVFGIHDLDAQAILGDFEQDLVLEFLQLRIFIDLVLQLLQKQFEALAFDLLGHALDLGAVYLRCHIRLWLSIDVGIDRPLGRQLWRSPHVDNVRRAALGEADRVLEIAGNGDFLLRGCR